MGNAGAGAMPGAYPASTYPGYPPVGAPAGPVYGSPAAMGPPGYGGAPGTGAPGYGGPVGAGAPGYGGAPAASGYGGPPGPGGAPGYGGPPGAGGAPGYGGPSGAGAPGYGASAPGYGSAPYTRDRKYSTGAGVLADLDRQFGEMGMDRDREYIPERERKISTGSGLGRPSKYSVPETAAERTRKISGNFGGQYPPTHGASRPYPGPGGVPYPTSGATEGPFIPPTYTNYPSAQRSDPYSRSSSPMPYGGNPNVYPPGHVLEGQPIPHSRATTPLPGGMSQLPGGIGGPMGGQMGPGGSGVPFPGGPVSFPQPTIGSSPRMPEQGQQLAAPAGFMRPINAAQPYTPFETMKIQDMDDFIENIPRMPIVLKPHDVYVEDWSRLMEVRLTLAA